MLQDAFRTQDRESKNRRKKKTKELCTLIFRKNKTNQKVSLTLTSLLSDSAIFLLRSIQRDECLIPIRAKKKKKNVLTLESSKDDAFFPDFQSSYFPYQ